VTGRPERCSRHSQLRDTMTWGGQKWIGPTPAKPTRWG
jgi:hypothetical protein